MMRSGRASRARSSASAAVGAWATAYPFAATTRAKESSRTPVIRTTGGTPGMSMSLTRGLATSGPSRWRRRLCPRRAAGVTAPSGSGGYMCCCGATRERPMFSSGARSPPRSRPSSLQGPPQRGGERFRIARLLVRAAIDEEPRGAAHAAPHAAQEVLAHARGVSVFDQLAHHPVGIDPELARVPHQVLVLERRLMLIQEIVHLPELALRGGGLGRLRGLGGVGVLFGQRKVPEHEADLGSELAQHALQLGVGGAAKRTLEVAVLDQGRACVRRSLDMVAGADGRGEQCSWRRLHRLAGASGPRVRAGPMRRASMVWKFVVHVRPSSVERSALHENRSGWMS